MSQKDRILGQNPYQKWLIQEKIAQFTGDKNSESTVPLYHTPKALTLKLRRCHKKTEFLAKILSKQGLYKKKACIFQILTMLNPQYLLNKDITMNLSQYEIDRIRGQNPIKTGTIQEKISYLSDLNNAQSTVPPYQRHNPEISK